jgi:CheY-like chemotaxis protein
MNVLIVDDSLVMRMIVERGMRHAGFGAAKMVHAANGLDALDKIERAEGMGEGFDLILTDIHMPVMNGPELLDEIRRRGLALGVPVVLITAEDADSASLMNTAGEELSRLTKPFTVEQMQERLTPLLQAASHG